MRGTTSFDVLSVKVCAGVLGRTKKNKKSIVNMRTWRVYISHMWGEETPGQITSKFCLVVGTQDIIACIKFDEDRLRGF